MARLFPLFCLLLVLAALPAFSASNDWQSALRTGNTTFDLTSASPVLDSILVVPSVHVSARDTLGVPEPSALLAFATGFIGLVGLAMRRRDASPGR